MQTASSVGTQRGNLSDKGGNAQHHASDPALLSTQGYSFQWLDTPPANAEKPSGLYKASQGGDFLGCIVNG